MKRVRWSIACLAAAPLSALPAAAQQPLPDFAPVTDPMLADPDPGDWLLWRRTLDGWGYSPLDQIDAGNVGGLALVWTRPLGAGIQEGTPLVYRGRMYFPSPGDVIHAFDAATGDLLWEHRRRLPDDIDDVFPVPFINRNLAIYDRYVIHNSADDYVFALDAETGEVAWETRILDYHVNPAQQTSGPIAANGRLFSGRGCEPVGGPDACVITAHDAKTGEELWRTRTIPAPGESGNETWGDVAWEDRWHVGTWMVPSYDPELNMVYIGTSVTSPAPKFMLAGNEHEYLYHNSTLALDGDTGEIVWYYQHLVDHWDLDHPFERLLIDTEIVPDADEVIWVNPALEAGERRRVVTGIPGKTGIVYTLDRETGEFLWARPTIEQNVVADVDGATGTVRVNPETLFHEQGDGRFICPSTNGGKNWPAGAYSPQTHTMYFPMQNTCAAFTAIAEEPSFDSLYAIAQRRQITPGTDKVGVIEAIRVDSGTTAWRYEQRAGLLSLVATGGGLLFGGDANGRFRALDKRDGEVLWEVNLGAPVTGYPVTFAVDGRQYVAVSTGSSLLTGGLNGLTPELRPGSANQLYVFALPER